MSSDSNASDFELGAMILAAGRGERLRPLTSVRAKPACPIGNWPLIWYALRFVRRQGYEAVAVNLHHLSGSIRRALAPAQAWGLAVHAVEEPVLLGTGGGPRALCDRFGAGPLLLLNGKLLLGGDLQAARRRHLESGAAATLFVWPNLDPMRYTRLLWDESTNRLERFSFARERRPNGAEPEGWMFTGVQFLSPALLERLPAGAPSDLVTGLYVPLLREGALIRIEPFPGPWCEVSDPGAYLGAHQWLLDGRLGAHGPALTAGNCVAEEVSIDSSAELSRCTVGRRSVVRARARLERSVLWEDVEIGSGCELRDAIVTAGAQLPEGCRMERQIALAGPNGGLQFFPLDSGITRRGAG
ncbi:MAG TPA: NDP-sugar synthase [Acidobacteriota bacterium]